MELNKFYNMDCMEGMAQIPDKYFELDNYDSVFDAVSDLKGGEL